MVRARGGGGTERVGEVSTFWWFKTERRRRPREERWSRQLRHYTIPNRKRDKANKTLSGRRSANRTLGEGGEERYEREREKERREQRELKLGTKVLTFVPSKVFQIMVVTARRDRRRGWRREEDLLCDLYLAKVSELLNFPVPKRKARWRRDARGAQIPRTERACTVIKPFSNED